MHKIVALGDKAVLAEFAQTLDLGVNLRIQRLARAIGRRRVPWVRDVVPGLASPALAQLAPGAQVRFARCSVQEAQRAEDKQLALLHALRSAVRDRFSP